MKIIIWFAKLAKLKMMSLLKDAKKWMVLKVKEELEQSFNFEPEQLEILCKNIKTQTYTFFLKNSTHTKKIWNIK